MEITEELMSLGEWSVPIDYRADTLAELVDDGRPRKVHALVYDADDVLIYTGLLLLADGDERGVDIGGRNLLWWLGVDRDGPMIEDREYVSGNNKLSNGDFHLDDLYWRTDGGWAIGSGAAGTSTTDKDATLASDEKWPSRPGYEYVASCIESRGAGSAVGRLRIRVVFEGQFAHPDILPTNWDDQSDTSGDAYLSAGEMVLGPCTPYRPIVNGSFDANLNNWIAIAGTWVQTTAESYGAPGSATSAGGGPSPKVLQYDSNPATAGVVDPVFFAPGSRWRFEGAVKGDAAADGEASIQLYIADVTWPSNPTWMVIARVLGTDPDKENWRYEQSELTVPEDKVAFVPMLQMYGHTAGNWYFDEIKATRIEGNVARMVNLDLAAVTPERSYTWRAHVRFDAALTKGQLRLRMMAFGTNRPTVWLESPSVEAKPGEDTVVEWDFATPSGYFVIQTLVEVTDAIGGSFRVSGQSIVDNDASTSVVDAISTHLPHAATPLAVGAEAPDGTEWVRVEVVAESEAGGFGVDNVLLVRDGVTPATGDAIVAELLTDPVTGAALSVAPGDIDCPEVIPYDWLILNLTARDALDHYCHVVSEPPREYRLNPDRTLDVKTAEELFVDHAPGTASPIILLDGDLDIPAGLPAVKADAERRVTDIKVIGADRPTSSGRSILVTATAQVPGTPEYDWNGNPVRRTRIVSDSTVDHWGFAQALAEDLADSETVAPLSIEATLSGVGTRPPFDVGDWVYVYKPESGILDLGNPTEVDGETVFPRRLRVLGRTRKLGPSHRIEIRRTDGATFDLPGVRWASEDATVLTLGERPRSFVADPQGGASGNQYLRDRASSPR